MSKEYSHLLDSLLDGNALSERQAYELMHKLAEGELPAALAGALLAGLRAKGETADEIRGFAFCSYSSWVARLCEPNG